LALRRSRYGSARSHESLGRGVDLLAGRKWIAVSLREIERLQQVRRLEQENGIARRSHVLFLVPSPGSRNLECLARICALERPTQAARVCSSPFWPELSQRTQPVRTTVGPAGILRTSVRGRLPASCRTNVDRAGEVASRKGAVRPRDHLVTAADCVAGATRQTVLPTSSATSKAPDLAMATPTGRPSASPAWSTNPVSTSKGLPAGRPSRKGTNTTLYPLS